MEANPAWRGGEVFGASGYVFVRNANHPFSSNGYVPKHRVVVEEWMRESDPANKFLTEIGGKRYLLPGLDVHHMDKNTENNERHNLVACTKQTHVLIHAGHGVMPGTFWPETANIKIDNVLPAIRMRERRKAKRIEKALHRKQNQ